MIRNFITYNIHTGEILGKITASTDDAFRDVAEDKMIIELVGANNIDNPENYYVNTETGQLTKKAHKFYSEIEIYSTVNTVDDVDLNKMILGNIQNETQVEVWRTDHFAILRYHSYPSTNEVNDANAKLSSSDPAIQAAGQIQLDNYYADCLAVKARFPKPDTE